MEHIQKFSDKTIVIKLGGSLMYDAKAIQKIMEDVALFNQSNIHSVIVHGGGSEISDMSQHFNIPTQFFNGQRVTDAATLEIVQTILLGKTNRNLVNMLNQCHVKAVGISGQDAAFLQAKKTDVSELGFVGDIIHVDKHLINTLLSANFIPIIAPIAVDRKGQAYNVNADIAAASIASHLGAEKLIIVSDVDGFYSDLNDPLTKISHLKIEMLQSLLEEKKISGGMIPKIQACLQAIEHNVKCAHIVSGKKQEKLLLEVLKDNTDIGTTITQ